MGGAPHAQRVMIFKRTVAKLRAQDWVAIAIELLIVIIGVFVGIQAANWNQARVERLQTERMLSELQPGLEHFIGFFDTAKPYYATTRAYADNAFAGWRGDPGVSNEQFVISAYQASQVYGLEINAVNWARIFGGDQVRSIDDPDIRRGLASLMSVDFADVGPAAVRTRYREQVRKVIPEDIQDLIRDRCGDRPIPGRPLLAHLPATCDLDLAPDRWAEAAAALRAHPDLVGELRWHLAAVATFLFNMGKIDQRTRNLSNGIRKLEG
ncbi:hypothetical protein [Sphingomonas sp.]|uniref:hypothetical protein n=1 Tax=Sphingomonas sp. TaxID=28214 RepID=UPI0025E5BFC6|nr:hypothetical protein [Sphingomonas sp.]